MSSTILDYPIEIILGEGSRISKKIIAALKAEKNTFRVTIIKTPVRLRMTDDGTQKAVVRFVDTKQPDKFKFLRDEIVALIPELFPVNYAFKVYNNAAGMPFNYKAEFQLSTPYPETGYVCFYTKINEQKARSKEINTYQIDITG